ncbi:MAG: hypothetical protein ACON4T_01415 [Synechococcus sp.]
MLFVEPKAVSIVVNANGIADNLVIFLCSSLAFIILNLTWIRWIYWLESFSLVSFVFSDGHWARFSSEPVGRFAFLVAAEPPGSIPLQEAKQVTD